MTTDDQQVPTYKGHKLKVVKVLIGIPTRGELKAECALTLAFMIHMISVRPVVMIDGEPRLLMWNVRRESGSLLPQLRQNFVDDAVQNKVDFLLFLDDDMIFDPELIQLWVAENRPVIAANCPTRSIPCYATARQYDPREPHKGSVVYSDVANTRFEKVWRVGTGIMLLRLDAARALPRPAFTIRWEPGNDAYVGEDWVLCEHLEAAGIPIVVDHKMSLSVKHVGEMAFSHEMAAGTRKAFAAQSGKGIIVPGTTVPKAASGEALVS